MHDTPEPVEGLHRGRPGTPVEVILRLLVVKRLYGWSYEEVERFVADSLVLSQFCRIYCERVPDDTTLLRWANCIAPETLAALNERVVVLARQIQVTRGRKLRLDGTVVDPSTGSEFVNVFPLAKTGIPHVGAMEQQWPNILQAEIAEIGTFTGSQETIHYPSDSSLLADGVRVVSRLLRRASPSTSSGGAGRDCQSRWGSVPHAYAQYPALGTRPASSGAAAQ